MNWNMSQNLMKINVHVYDAKNDMLVERERERERERD